MKIFLAISAIIALAVPFAHAVDPSDESLVLYFSFDELNGDTEMDTSLTPVDPLGKLSTTWATLKSQR